MSLDAGPVRAQFPALAGGRLHYLDNAAMAQTPRAVIAAVAAHESRARANVGRAVHDPADAAEGAYEAARETVARFLNADGADEVVFTPGCTAAINLLALALAPGLAAGDEIVVSRAEHHSNLLPWMMLRDARGIALRFAPLDAEGRIDAGAAAAMIGPRCRLVALAHASNVTGAVLDPAPVVAAARAAGARVLLDGAQVVAHRPVDVAALGVDFYAFSGHKMYGPTGVGVLWGRRAALRELPPAFGGGGMVGAVDEAAWTFADPPRRFEAGTPPVTQAIGLAAAIDWLGGIDRMAVAARERRLTVRLLDGLRTIPGLRVVGPGAGDDRVPVVSFAIDGLHPHDVAHILAERGVAVRAGHHCAQPLMAALGLAEAGGAVRASLSAASDDSDVAALLDGLRTARATLSATPPPGGR